jgi:hypothetical protein
MWENRVRENIASKFVQVCHIDGKINLADVFTKEMKDTSHFVEIRASLCVIVFLPDYLAFIIFISSCLAFEGGVSGSSNTVTLRVCHIQR